MFTASSRQLSVAPSLRAEEEAFAFRVPSASEYWAHAVRPAWILVFAATLVLVAGTCFGPFIYAPWHETLRRVAVVGILILGSAIFRANRCFRSALMMEIFALTIAVSLTIPGLTTMIAALNMPYRDAELLAIDHAMGFDWHAITMAIHGWPELSKVLEHSYASLTWQPLILFSILAYVDPERLRRIAGALAIALAIAIAFFVFVPAKAAYVHYGYDRADFPSMRVIAGWAAYDVLENIRAGGRQLSLEGLITFPSYHAVSAVLLAYGWWSVPVLRYPFMILNLIMLVSCVPIGAHYLIDVLAGLALAYASYVAVDRYYDASDPLPPLERWWPHQLQIATALRSLPTARWLNATLHAQSSRVQTAGQSSSVHTHPGSRTLSGANKSTARITPL